MTTILKLIFGLFLLHLGNSIYAQEDQGVIVFRMYPIKEKLFIEVQDSVYTTPKLTLPAGSHDVVLWSPHKMPLDTTIQIYSDSTVYLKRFMSPTPAYNLYHQSLRKYHKKVTIPKVITVSVSTGISIATILSYRAVQTQWDRVENQYGAYQGASHYTVRDSELSLQDAKDKFESKKKKFRIAVVATGVSMAVTTWVWFKLRKEKRPVLYPDEPPFQISYVPSAGGSNPYSSQLKFTLVKKFSNE